MSIDLNSSIQKELSPYFKYATPMNPSQILASWRDSSKELRTHLVYKHCVSCNSSRFKGNESIDLTSEIDTYFCKPCFKKLAIILKKYDSGIDSEENKIFNKMWNDYRFGQKYISHSSRL